MAKSEKCPGFTRKGEPCQRPAREGFHTCVYHAREEPGEEVVLDLGTAEGRYRVLLGEIEAVRAGRRQGRDAKAVCDMVVMAGRLHETMGREVDDAESAGDYSELDEAKVMHLEAMISRAQRMIGQYRGQTAGPGAVSEGEREP